MVNKSTEDFAITTVADHFGLPISTLHYWERQGLLAPHRRAGRRFYSMEQVYRIALIQLWRETGQLGLADIAEILHGDPDRDWREVVTDRMSAIRGRMDSLAAAHDYLEHLRSCQRDHDLEQCPGFRGSVSVPRAGAESG